MPSTEHILQLEEQGVQVTSEDVRKTGQLFWRGRSNNTPYEELVLDISRKLKPLIGAIKKDRVESIAMLVKVLIGSRTINEAREYLKTEEGVEWLRRQWKIPEPPAVALGMAGTTSDSENPTIAVVETDPIVLATGNVANPLQHVNLAAEAFATSLEGLPGTTGPFVPMELGVPTMAQPLVPGSPRQSSAHSRTPSDVSIDFSTERCRRCQQIHPNNLVMAMAMLQVLERNGYRLDGQRPTRAGSGRSTRRERVTPSGSPTLAVEQLPGALPTNPPSRQRSGLDAVVMVWLVVLTLSLLLGFFWDVLPRLLSKPKI